ncbi:MAG TPA: class I SAM-dependent methyltransferase [Ignavibacteria bacterium]|nr:class I SAM-dependent methyltransferase [Ignavibacteria bacterium]HMR40232.1 class I SAM-dependent methyltransferase [Ignavibacteria bacterium]
MQKEEILKKLNKHYKFPEKLISTIDTEIDPKDEMFEKDEEEHYFNVGFSCLEIINNTLESEKVDKKKIKTILDFPCGYGRELRFLKSFFSESSLYGCEIEEDKLNFVKKKFSATPVLSYRDFKRINLNQKFDLIWCGSLFTHISARRFRKLLLFFFEHLNDEGFLFFTTHGRYSASILNTYGLRSFQRIYIKSKYYLTGFGYNSYLKQYKYGVSLSAPSWVLRSIEKYKDISIVGVSEKRWDNHQDVIICRKNMIK